MRYAAPHPSNVPGKLSHLQHASRKAQMLSGLSLTALLAACGGGDDGGGAAPARPLTFTRDEVTGIYQSDDGSAVLSQGSATLDLVVDGGGGDESITTGSGDDLVRAGTGGDTVSTGDGDDKIIMVGATGTNAYSDAGLDSISTSAVLSADLINGQIGDSSVGDKIDGGGGTDALYTLGTLDLTRVEISNVEHLYADGDVTLDMSQLSSNGGSLQSLNLDLMGSDGILRLTNTGGLSTPVNWDTLSALGIEKIELGSGVVLEITSQSELADASITMITGSGTINVIGAKSGDMDLSAYLVGDGVIVQANGTVDGGKLGGLPYSGHTGVITEGDWDTMGASGTLKLLEGAIVAGTYTGDFGSVTIAENGNWAYSATLTGAQSAKATSNGDSQVDRISIPTSGAAASINITVRGAEDSGQFTAGHTGNVTEADKHSLDVSMSGTVVIDDPDANDPDPLFVVPATGLSGLFGTLDMDGAGNWTYTLDHSKTQFSRTDESVKDRVYVTLSDGSIEAIVITIQGVDETETLDDPLYSQQHHFDAHDAGYNIINIQDVWQRDTGLHVDVGVVDDGVDKTHVDLAANYAAAREVAGVGGFPTGPGDSTHGTAVAGIIGAVGQNDTGVVGIAFNADLTDLPFLSSSNKDAIVDAWSDFSLLNNSWGSSLSFSDLSGSRNNVGLTTAMTDGRGGWAPSS